MEHDSADIPICLGAAGFFPDDFEPASARAVVSSFPSVILLVYLSIDRKTVGMVGEGGEQKRRYRPNVASAEHPPFSEVPIPAHYGHPKHANFDVETHHEEPVKDATGLNR